MIELSGLSRPRKDPGILALLSQRPPPLPGQDFKDVAPPLPGKQRASPSLMRLGQPVDTPGFLEGWGRGLNLSLPGPYASLFQHLSFILFYFPVWRRRRCALSRCLFSPPAALFRDQAELGAGPVSQVNWAGSDPRLSLTSALRNNPSRFGRTFGEGEGGSLGKKNIDLKSAVILGVFFV